MRWTVFIILQILIIGGLLGLFRLHQDSVAILKKPPQSIAQWYKPANERQVWLHTMFKLRREMQALEIYAQSGEADLLQKWTTKFGKSYTKVAEMVPEWSHRLNFNALGELQAAALEKNFQGVSASLKKLETTCKDCHTGFQAVTAALYRAPDFTGLNVDGKTPLADHMNLLSDSVNRIVIGFGDGHDEAAIKAAQALKSQMAVLGKTCANCHGKMPKAYPDEAMQKAMTTLDASLASGTLKDKGRAIGTLAVLACANCHETHRIGFSLRQELGKSKSLAELFKEAH